MSTQSRRRFVSTGGMALLSGLVLRPTAPANAQRKPPIEPDLVKEFVSKSHGNLTRIREMVAAQPTIVNATWDWGNGDWETGLGAASHMGRVDIADFLLSNGARKDVFCAAMKGEFGIVQASVAADPSVATLAGPHRISLLFHAALSGQVDVAKVLVENGAHDDRALHAAIWYDRYDMVRWLVENDTKDINVIRGKKTPLDFALEKGHERIADYLREKGATTRL